MTHLLRCNKVRRIGGANAVNTTASAEPPADDQRNTAVDLRPPGAGNNVDLPVHGPHGPDPALATHAGHQPPLPTGGDRTAGADLVHRELSPPTAGRLTTRPPILAKSPKTGESTSGASRGAASTSVPPIRWMRGNRGAR